MKKLDIILIIVAIVAAGILYFSGILGPSDMGDYAVVYLDGKEYERLPLDKEGTLIVENGSKKNVIKVSEGNAYMEDANCPDGLCKKQGKISRKNETVVCLPNKVHIEIASELDVSEFDSISK